MPNMPNTHRPNRGTYKPVGNRAIARKLRNTRRWQKLSRMFRSEYPLCWGCGAAGEQVHHIIGIAEAPDLAYDWDNLATVCTGCHSKLEAGQDLTLKRGWLDELNRDQGEWYF